MDPEIGSEASTVTELYCNEKPPYTPYPAAGKRAAETELTPYHPKLVSEAVGFIPALEDRLLDDVRIIENMLVSERHCRGPTGEYLHTSNVNGKMRTILLRWMFEVSTK